MYRWFIDLTIQDSYGDGWWSAVDTTHLLMFNGIEYGSGWGGGTNWEQFSEGYELSYTLDLNQCYDL